VTIPGELRHRHGIVEGDEVDVVEDGNAHHKTPIDQPRRHGQLRIAHTEALVARNKLASLK